MGQNDLISNAGLPQLEEKERNPATTCLERYFFKFGRRTESLDNCHYHANSLVTQDIADQVPYIDVGLISSCDRHRDANPGRLCPIEDDVARRTALSNERHRASTDVLWVQVIVRSARHIGVKQVYDAGRVGAKEP